MKIKILIIFIATLIVVLFSLGCQLRANLKKTDTGLGIIQPELDFPVNESGMSYSDSVKDYLNDNDIENLSNENDDVSDLIPADLKSNNHAETRDIGGSEPVNNPKASIVTKEFDPDNFEISDYEDIIKKYNANWYSRWVKFDNNFLEKFSKEGTGFIRPLAEYEMQPYHLMNMSDHLYSPDAKYLLNVVYGGDPDTQVDLVDLKNKKVKQLLNCGTPCLFENGYWFDNNNFIVVASLEYYADSEEYNNKAYYDQFNVPMVYHYNLAKNEVTTYIGIKVTRWDFYGLGEEFMKVNVFWGGCHGVNKYERIVPKSEKIATETLKALFNGPNESGIRSIFSYKTSDILKEVIIKDRIAYVNLKDFRNVMDLRNDCDRLAFFEQANRTLTQYSTIKDAVYFIEGSDYNFYHWIYSKCPWNMCANNPFQSDYIKLIRTAENIYQGSISSDNLWYGFEIAGSYKVQYIDKDFYSMPYNFRLTVNVPFDQDKVESAYMITYYGSNELPVIKEIVFKSNNIWHVPEKMHVVVREQTYDIIFKLTDGQKLKKSFKLRMY